MKRPTDDFWRQLSQLDMQLNTISYYKLLGLERTAEPRQLRSHYERQVRALHPDRHVLERDPARKECLTRVFARLGEAFHVLSHGPRRASYDQGLQRGEMRLLETRKKVVPRDPEHPQAIALLDKAKRLLAEGDKRSALATLQLASQYQSDSLAIQEAIAGCHAPEPPVTLVPPRLPPEVEETVDATAVTIARARGLIDDGQWNEACRLLRQPLRDHPEDSALLATYHLAAGLAARERGLEAPAYNHFASALRYDPDSPMILRYLQEEELS